MAPKFKTVNLFLPYDVTVRASSLERISTPDHELIVWIKGPLRFVSIIKL